RFLEGLQGVQHVHDEPDCRGRTKNLSPFLPLSLPLSLPLALPPSLPLFLSPCLQRFFAGLQAYNELMKSQNGSDFIPFSTFMSFLQMQATRYVARMDPHVRPQINLCKLNSIRYDFIGRFENLEEDVAKVMQQFGKEGKDAFNIGHGAHPTNASDKLLELYDQGAFEAAMVAYKTDFSVPLNGLEYGPPQALVEKFGSGTS
ncbi:unnamed protein product, partial [Closterium sp. NIES-54]